MRSARVILAELDAAIALELAPAALHAELQRARRSLAVAFDRGDVEALRAGMRAALTALELAASDAIPEPAEPENVPHG